MGMWNCANKMITDDVTADRVYRDIHSAQIQPNPAKLIRQHFTV